MAAAYASLGVCCDNWRIGVVGAERLENVRTQRVSFSVGNSRKSLLVRGKVSMEREEQLQSCRCRRRKIVNTSRTAAAFLGPVFIFKQCA
jgi:hypothetical protein